MSYLTLLKRRVIQRKVIIYKTLKTEIVKTGLESENLESLTNEKINASGSYSAENFEEIGEVILVTYENII